MRQSTLYVVYDKLAQEYIGQIQVMRHDAAATRFFGDVASRQDTIVGAHPTDFELHAIAYLDEENNLTIENFPRTVITGTQWLNAQQPAEPNLKLENA